MDISRACGAGITLIRHGIRRGTFPRGKAFSAHAARRVVLCVPFRVIEDADPYNAFLILRREHRTRRAGVVAPYTPAMTGRRTAFTLSGPAR